MSIYGDQLSFANEAASIDAIYMEMVNFDGYFKEADESLQEGIKDAAKNVWAKIKEVAKKIWEFIKGIFAKIKGFFTKSKDSTEKDLKDVQNSSEFKDVANETLKADADGKLDEESKKKLKNERTVPHVEAVLHSYKLIWLDLKNVIKPGFDKGFITGLNELSKNLDSTRLTDTSLPNIDIDLKDYVIAQNKYIPSGVKLGSTSDTEGGGGYGQLSTDIIKNIEKEQSQVAANAKLSSLNDIVKYLMKKNREFKDEYKMLLDLEKGFSNVYNSFMKNIDKISVAFERMNSKEDIEKAKKQTHFSNYLRIYAVMYKLDSTLCAKLSTMLQKSHKECVSCTKHLKIAFTKTANKVGGDITAQPDNGSETWR